MYYPLEPSIGFCPSGCCILDLYVLCIYLHVFASLLHVLKNTDQH